MMQVQDAKVHALQGSAECLDEVVSDAVRATGLVHAYNRAW